MSFPTFTPMNDHLRYPIGHYTAPASFSKELLQNWTEQISTFPTELLATVRDFTPEQLDTPYRPGGWTGRQVVHHLADSHLNAYTRFKLTLTENTPTIKPYQEAEWAELLDSRLPIEPSLHLIGGLHRRWSELLRAFGSAEWERTLYHPEMNRKLPLRWMLGMYDWHCRHHLAHLRLIIGA